ncbi:hypothetical protein BAOM_4834 [Peribacillus asahii]|uniref:Uncharacterized protein n=1 Tax=Peribacillus asahii TaxID=228899 RepID=A0A3Q9RR68_9BACI|nr:hypothetical protein BAOM_4834 [Peribacillus asahii]
MAFSRLKLLFLGYIYSESGGNMPFCYFSQKFFLCSYFRQTCRILSISSLFLSVL